jgi:iron(III) transport system ATP-binding protein
LIRPENVLISPDPAGPHVVERRMYFGHDQLVELRLADGNTLRARIQPWIELDEGAHVQVRVWGGAVAFAP